MECYYSNIKKFTGWRLWLTNHFSDKRWARKIIGGLWEKWFIAYKGPNYYLWMPVIELSKKEDEGDIDLVKTVAVEDWSTWYSFFFKFI